jgi:hypothetical protein
MGSSKDDEYLRLILTSRADTFKNPTVQQLLPKVHRGLARRQSRGFLTSFTNDIRYVRIKDASGKEQLHPAFQVKEKRLNSIISKVVKGLMYHALNRRLPSGYAIRVISDIEDLPENVLLGLVEPLSREPHIIIGNRVFAYTYKVIADEPDVPAPFASLWLLSFYETVPFFIIVGAEKDLVPGERQLSIC